MSNNSRILTKVKGVYFTPWKADDSGLDTAKRFSLINLIGDTVAITQDDNETNAVEAETRDEPIIETITLGKYNVTMDSADIGDDIMKACFGYAKSGNILYAPASYSRLFGRIEVVMSDNSESTFVLPRVLLASKLDASSLKTGVAKGTIGGSAYTCKVTTGTGSSATTVETPFFICASNESYTLSPLTSGATSGSGSGSGNGASA